jgi:hypothetical protein
MDGGFNSSAYGTLVEAWLYFPGFKVGHMPVSILAFWTIWWR